MRATAVPAQVTTVEDRIFGNLGMSQVILLFIVVVGTAAIFTIAPPAMEGALYKYILMAVIGLVCGTLAIRIKGKIIALWLVVLLSYSLRPKYYLYNKNVSTLRESYTVKTEKKPKKNKVAAKAKERTAHPQLDIPTTAAILATIENPAANFRIETGKKGNLHVRLTEIEK
jgi:hypothetical protein